MRPVRRPILVALVVAASAALGGCALMPDVDGGQGGQVGAGTGAPGAGEPGHEPGDLDGSDVAGREWTAADVRAEGLPVSVGDGVGTVWVVAAGSGPDAIRTTPRPDGSVVVTAPLDVSGGRPVYVVGVEGTVPVELLDRSVVIRDADGTPVVGLAAPTAVRVDGAELGVWYSADAGTGAVAVIPRTASADTGLPGAEGGAGESSAGAGAGVEAGAGAEVTIHVGVSAIDSTAWGEREGGRSLAVVPTDWLRDGTLAAQELGWSQLVALVPEAATRTMRDQYDCHALGAREKASWNLEPWRPDVGVLDVLAARCNPT